MACGLLPDSALPAPPTPRRQASAWNSAWIDKLPNSARIVGKTIDADQKPDARSAAPSMVSLQAKNDIGIIQ
jgi:hypothetical protein